MMITKPPRETDFMLEKIAMIAVVIATATVIGMAAVAKKGR